MSAAGRRRSKHDAERNDVVVGDPPAERDQVFDERRLSVRNLDDALGLSLRRVSFERSEADADFLSLRKGTTTRDPGDRNRGRRIQLRM